MWFSDYANKKYSADKSALSPNGTWWVRWFQLSLVQQVSIFAFCLAGGGDLTALCKVSFLPAQPCPVRPPVTPHPPWLTTHILLTHPDHFLLSLSQANALNYGLAGARMVLSQGNMDSTQFKINLVVMVLMIAANLSGAGVF
jgi:hypothetical protein